MSKIWNHLTDWERSPIYAYFKSKIVERQVKELIAALKDEDIDSRKYAADALGELKDPTATPALTDALEDEDPFVRLHAAGALGKIRDPTATPALIVALKDENWIVREESAWALGEIKGSSAGPALIDALKDEYWNVNVKASQALIKIGKPVVPMLGDAIKSEFWKVRLHAANALGASKDPATVSLLIDTLGDDYFSIRRNAVDALKKTVPGNQGGLKLLRKKMREAKQEGKHTEEFIEVYTCWSNELRTRANRHVSAAKTLPKPRVPGKPGSNNRINRAKRAI